MEKIDNTLITSASGEVETIEEEYVRIGTTLFRIINQPMMNGSFRKMRVEWKMSIFRLDHGKDEAALIPKYDGFCTMPSHTDYRLNVNNFYNLYEPITHIPKEGEFSHIQSLIEHIFGEQYELGMDYLQLLYLKPTQKLPILLLVSEERNMGKSTFLNFLKALFQENVTFNTNEDFRSQFNADWAGKLMIQPHLVRGRMKPCGNKLGTDKVKRKQLSIDIQSLSCFTCTQTRGRTGMEVNPLVFETSASTDSAIWASFVSQMRCKDTAFFDTRNTFRQKREKKQIIIRQTSLFYKIYSTLAETLNTFGMMTNKNNYCVIMSGGIGSRFWPFSRKTLPKQFLDFFGTGRSLLQQTFDRFNKIIPTENILVVTNALYADLIREQLPELKPEQILLEPTRRNTAPCIAWAAYHIRALNPDANIVVAPSDHLILKESEFLTAIKKGLEFVAESEKLLTLGIKPNRPETGYGYIQIAEHIDSSFYKVKTFTEKPELELAKVFVESGEFYWNAGLFMWNVNSIIKTGEQLLPELANKLAAGTEVYGTPDEQKFIDENFPACPNVSIDFGVMEKADNVYVSLGDFGWSDLGTWSSLYDLTPKDKAGNVTLQCRSMLYNSKNNIVVLPQDKLAVIDGLEGYLVAESNNVLLICKKDEEHSIRKYVNDTQIKLGEEYI